MTNSSGKDKIRKWFKSGRSKKMLRFYNLYYDSKNPPSVRTVRRVIFEENYNDYHKVWDNAIEFYKDRLATEEYVNKKLKEAAEL